MFIFFHIEQLLNVTVSLYEFIQVCNLLMGIKVSVPVMNPVHQPVLVTSPLKLLTQLTH